MIEAVIFDLDGVIVHTDVCHYKAWKKVADKLGIPFDENINNELRGVSRMESLEIILRNADIEFSISQKEKLAEEKNEYYKEYLRDITPNQVATEILDALNLLKEKGYKLAIGSSSRNARMLLENIDLLDYFDAVSDGNNISHSKPDPEVFLKAAKYLQVGPSECIVVEDADSGIQAGRNAGMVTISYGNLIRSETANYHIESLSDIFSILPGL